MGGTSLCSYQICLILSLSLLLTMDNGHSRKSKGCHRLCLLDEREVPTLSNSLPPETAHLFDS